MVTNVSLLLALVKVRCGFEISLNFAAVLVINIKVGNLEDFRHFGLTWIREDSAVGLFICVEILSGKFKIVKTKFTRMLKPWLELSRSFGRFRPKTFWIPFFTA